MKTIKDAVIELEGKWPAETEGDTLVFGNVAECYWAQYHVELDLSCETEICTRDEFEAEAKRLGYINGYRWGIEYPTNGKRPDLPDDVDVEIKSPLFDGYSLNGDFRRMWKWNAISAFKITDPRYKPADTSYLGAPTKDHIVEAGEMVANARPCWPPVAGMTVELWFGGQYVENVEFLCERGGNVIFWRYSNDSVDSAAMPTAELKPIRTKREKVIEAAVQVCTGVKIAKVSDGLTMNTLNKLYNAGMLVLQPKKSDTKD